MLGSKRPAWQNIQLFLWCISTHHFCQLPSFFDPHSAAVFCEARVSSHTQVCKVGIGPHSSRRHCMSFPHHSDVMSHSAESLCSAYSQSSIQFALGSDLVLQLLLLIYLCYAMGPKDCIFCSVSIFHTLAFFAGLRGSYIFREPMLCTTLQTYMTV